MVENGDRKWYNQIETYDIEKIKYVNLFNREYEMLPQTVEREVREEAGIEVKCKDFCHRGVHGESFHRMDLVFLCDYLGNSPNATLQGDTNQVGFDWLDLSILNKLPLFPSKLRRPIMNFHEGKEYMKYLGNEEIGDPECLE